MPPIQKPEDDKQKPTPPTVEQMLATLKATREELDKLKAEHTKLTEQRDQLLTMVFTTSVNPPEDTEEPNPEPALKIDELKFEE